MKKVILPILLVLYFILFSSSAHAEILFQDDFEDGNDNGWTKLGAISQATWKVENGVYKAKVNSSSTVVDVVAGDESWTDYVFEFDMYPKSGQDKNIDAKWTTGSGFGYEIHYTDGGFDTTGGIVVHSPIFNGQSYHMKLVFHGTNVKYYRNGVLMYDQEYPLLKPNGKIGFRVGTGAAYPSEVWFDNVKVTAIDSSSLSVPSLKQTDPLWSNDIYDSAGLWTTESPTIGRWGCAITSATMVLQYHKVNKLPDGTLLTPGTLNAYLKSIPDGYHKNGLTNWVAIATMTKKAKPQNPDFSYNALEYKNKGSNNLQVLTNDIENNIPNILEVAIDGNQHFVVGKGVSGSQVFINDPGFERGNLSAYGNSYVSTRRFVPSNTDLSYLVFDIDPNVQIVLKDEFGNEVGDVSLESPIADPLGLLTNSVGSLRILNFAQPLTGQYTLEVSSSADTTYDLNGFIYDNKGDVKVVDIAGAVPGGEKDVYTINFTKNDIDQTLLSVPSVSFDSLLSDVAVLYDGGNITKKGSYNFLLNRIERAKGYSETDPDRSVALLNDVRRQLIDDKKRGIDEFASQYLIDQITLLLNSF